MMFTTLFISHMTPLAGHMTVLHVEQEVVGDDTAALASVLECDEERETLLKRERDILSGG